MLRAAAAPDVPPTFKVLPFRKQTPADKCASTCADIVAQAAGLGRVQPNRCPAAPSFIVNSMKRRGAHSFWLPATDKAEFGVWLRAATEKNTFVIANVGMAKKDHPDQWRRSGHYVIVLGMHGLHVYLFDPKDGLTKRILLDDLFYICQTPKTRGLVVIETK